MKISMIIILLMSLFSSPCFSIDRENLVINPGFENNWEGWDSLWVREKGQGNAALENYTHKPGGMVLRIRYSGEQDWAVGQKRKIDVLPGEVYALSAWVKCVDVRRNAQISVVLWDKDNKVIDWAWGLIETGGTHGWKRLDTRFMIPRGPAQIQFRISGFGKGISLWDDLSLIRIKDSPISPDKKPDNDAKEISISQKGTKFSYSFDTELITINSDSHSRDYTLRGLGDSFFLKGVETRDNSLFFTLQNTSYKDIIASASIPSHNEVVISLTGDGVMDTDFAFPGSLTGQDALSWVIPQNEGLFVPADDPNYEPYILELFQGHGGLSMPFLGLTGLEQGIMFISTTPDDNYLRFHKPDTSKHSLSGWTFMWKPQNGMWGYKRELKILLIDEGGYVGMAKAYRQYAREKNLLVTLKEKRETVPGVDLLIGAANVWWWDKAEWWTRNLECGPVARELKEAGFSRVLWSNQASPRAIEDMNDLGYLTGRYDMYQDVWDPATPIKWLNKEGWPGDLVLNQDGSWRRGWVHKEKGKEYPGGIICSQPGFQRMKKNVAADLKTHPYKARFIDTTTAVPLFECYNPAHPLSRSGDREYKSKLLGSLSGEFHMVTGSETGIDWAVPYLHYFEGMMSLGPYRVEDAGYDLVSYKKTDRNFLLFQVGPYYRIPLFELVYHDCIVSFWYWGDASNRLPEVWRIRDLFNLLYGTGPLYIMDPERWKKEKKRFIGSYETATMISRNTGYEEMLIHSFVTPDHTVQYTRFSNRTEVWINLGDTPYIFENGEILPPLEYKVKFENQK
ncbi:MAG: carbohydrate binding domain-containing protein [Spirochaetales bacterium]|nr:carbohydrate binding domain-containing protein [Spirochaetales bacterium]